MDALTPPEDVYRKKSVLSTWSIIRGLDFPKHNKFLYMGDCNEGENRFPG